MEEQDQTKVETNSLPSEYQSDCYDDSQLAQGDTAIDNSEQFHETFTKLQRVIDTALPLLPTRIKDNMNSARASLEQIVGGYQKKFEGFDFLNANISYEDFMVKLNEVAQLSWLLNELVKNFKVNFNSSLFEKGILTSIKCISVVTLTNDYPHLEKLLSP